MNSFERAVDYAEYLVELGKQNPTYLQKFSNTASSKGKSIQQKLLDLYIEETGKQLEDKNLQCNTHLLKKLVRREKLNCLILNLYPGNEGYSLMLRGKTGVETETCKLPYEITELLDYIDDSELPPFLVDVLEKVQVNVFYNGCVIVEVRDFRRSTNGFDMQYVLLKPTTQTMLYDINNLTNDGNVWSQEDLFLLESRLLLATEEPLCLDPSPAVVLVANRQQYDRRKLNTPSLKRSVKKYSQAAVNRKRKFEQSPAPRELKLHDFICSMREKKSGSTQASKSKSSVDSWKFKPVPLTAPESVDVEKFAKVIERPKINSHEDNTLNLVEEHILERDGVQDKKLLAKLTIYHRRADAAYIGQLYLDHDYMEDKSKGATCRYLLGNEDSVNRYLDQFRQIFTEEGRRAVKITSHRPGHPSLVTYTQNAQAVAASSASLQNQNGNKVLTTVSNLQPVEVSQMSTLTMSTHMAPLRRTMPIQLSLSIGTNAVGNQPGQNQMLQQPGSSPAGSQLQMNMQSPLLSQSQLATHRLQQTNQSQSASQRLKQLGIHTNIASRNNTPTASPVTPQPPLGQMFGSPTSTGNPSMLPQQSKTPSRTPTPTATPPPIMSPPAQTLGLVRKASLTSTESSTIHHMPQTIHQSNVGTFLQGDNSGTPPCTVSHQPAGVTSLNIANITGIPPNINIQNLTGLPGMNIANLQGLQNMQVSLSLAGGNIAVPINMINTNAVLQNQQIITTTMNNMQVAMTTVMTLPHSSVITMTSQQGASVTMTPSTQINVTGVLTQSSNVIPGTGMLSLPVSLGGNITQLVPAAMKSQGQLRASASVPLQLQGIQLVNIQQQRAPVKHGGNIQAGQTVGQLVVKPTLSVQGPITTTILPGQNLGGPGQPVLSPMSLGKSASVGSIATTFTSQQLLQFPQFQTHLQTFQKPPQPQQPQLHFHPILRPSAISMPATMSFGGKPKSKQQTTPPKQ